MNSLVSIFDKLKNRKITKVQKGIGSFFTIDFEKKDALKHDDFVFHFWVYLCEWSIYVDLINVLDSELINSHNCKDVFEKIENNLIENFLFESNKISILMTDNVVIEMFISSFYDDDDDVFLFYNDDDSVVSFCKKKGLYIENKDDK